MIQSYQQGSSMMEVLERLPTDAQKRIDELRESHPDSPADMGFWDYRYQPPRAVWRAMAAELLYLLHRVVEERDELQATLDENESQAMDRNLYDGD